MKKKILTLIPILVLGIMAGIIKEKNTEIKLMEKKSEKDLHNVILFEQWLFIKQDNKSIEDYLKRKEIKTIAIYGMDFVGERLYDELKDTSIEVRYAIDRRGGCLCGDIPVISLEEEFDPVDAIVVSAVYYFDEIKESLLMRTDIPVVSLETLLFES